MSRSSTHRRSLRCAMHGLVSLLSLLSFHHTKRHPPLFGYSSILAFLHTGVRPPSARPHCPLFTAGHLVSFSVAWAAKGIHCSQDFLPSCTLIMTSTSIEALTVTIANRVRVGWREDIHTCRQTGRRKDRTQQPHPCTLLHAVLQGKASPRERTPPPSMA